MAADCLLSPLLEQLTALAACVLSAAPQGRALCQTLLEVLPCRASIMWALFSAATFVFGHRQVDWA